MSVSMYGRPPYGLDVWVVVVIVEVIIIVCLSKCPNLKGMVVIAWEIEGNISINDDIKSGPVYAYRRALLGRHVVDIGTWAQSKKATKINKWKNIFTALTHIWLKSPSLSLSLSLVSLCFVFRQNKLVSQRTNKRAKGRHISPCRVSLGPLNNWMSFVQRRLA